MKITEIILVSALLLSCNLPTKNHPSGNVSANNNIAEPSLNKTFNIIADSILKDYQTWYRYTYFNVPLSQDFIGLDTDANKIEKTTFLNKLMTENVVALRPKMIDGNPVYQLYRLNNNDPDIKTTSEQLASIEMKHYKMEGQQIPTFNYTDLNGNNYTSASTKGKVLLLKCWFIHCMACVKEFPECNNLVDEYKDRKDLLFISLASDTKDQLETFLQTKPFKYAVVAKLEDYMSNKLDINGYPTHLLIDRNGKIIKVVNTLKEMEPFLKREMSRD